MVLVEPGNNLAVQFGRGFNCELQLLLRYVARRIVAGYVPLFRESPHLLDHLGISVDGQFERLNRLRVVPDLNRRSIGAPELRPRSWQPGRAVPGRPDDCD